MEFMKINIVFFAVIKLWLQLSSTTYASCSTAIYSFGDSLADTGNLLASIISNGSKPEFDNLPYGETYFGKPTGRFSDGRLIVDYIANASGLPLLDPYLRNRTSTFKCGVNFAFAGATALDPNFFASKNITLRGTPFSLDTQIQWFLSLRPKICATYRGRGEVIYILIWVGQTPRLKLTAYNKWISEISLVLRSYTLKPLMNCIA